MKGSVTGFILFFLLCLTAFADGNLENQKSCGFEALTDNCSMFSTTGEYKIKLPDGTYIPNVTALLEAAGKARDQSAALIDAELESLKAAAQDRQFQVVQMLDEIPSSKMNSALKFMLANNPSILGSLFSDWGNKPPNPMPLPWPPEKANAPIKSVDAVAAKAALMPFFSEEQRQRLITIKNNEGQIDYKKLMTDMMRSKHPLSDEMNTIAEPRRQRVDELVQFVRDSVINNLVGGKLENQWSESERAAVEKIKAINYRDGNNPNVKNNSSCMGLVPNAFYEPGTNSINICSGFYNYPDATLVAVLAHEMGHAIDPCGCQFHFYSIDRTKFNALSSSGAIPAEIDKDEDLKFVYNELKNITKNGASVTAYPFDEFLKDPAKIKYFVDKGILEPGPGRAYNFEQTGNKMKGYILADVYECLSSEQGGPFRQTTQSEIDSAADLIVSKRMAIADQNYDSIKDKEKIVRAFTRYPQCNSPRSTTQMREAVADWFGSRVLGDFLKDKELKTKEERLAPIAFFASLICKDRAKIRTNSGTQSILETIEDSFNVLEENEGAHPGDKSRIEKIFLADLRVRKALGCKEDRKSGCLHSIGGDGQNSSVKQPTRSVQ